jgi:hypothetical protein
MSSFSDISQRTSPAKNKVMCNDALERGLKRISFLVGNGVVSVTVSLLSVFVSPLLLLLLLLKGNSGEDSIGIDGRSVQLFGLSSCCILAILFCISRAYPCNLSIVVSSRRTVKYELNPGRLIRRGGDGAGCCCCCCCEL